ncbi:MAG TPA: hypothetical protein VFD32_22655 [Dehalococcoidia bacterium]|nr:hypothetical protein [Dehalococcoidia bacterium]
MGVRDWLGRWFGDYEQAPQGPAAWAPGPERPRPRTILYWALAVWTGLNALALLFSGGSVAKALAGGLGDQAGRHLLGVQLLLLAIVYGTIARRSGWLEWLPLLAEWLIAIVLAYDWLAGRRSFSATALALIVAIAFALLLAGFRLAGESTIHTQYSGPATANGLDAAGGARTERLSRHSGEPGPVPAAEPAKTAQDGQDASDDRVLGA